MARLIVRDLLANRDVESVGIADLDLPRTRSFAKVLRTDRARPLRADARDPAGLRKVMKRWDVVVNSTWYELNLGVMDAAIATGVHYVDLGGLYHMTLKQLKRDRAARDAGVTCLLGMGSTPGTMNVMAAHAAAQFDRLDSVKLRSAGVVVSGPRDVFVAPYSIRTMLDEFSMDAPVWRDGRIRTVPALSGRDTFDMPDPVGRVEGYFTIHSELATLPQNLGKGLRELDFTLAFAPEFTQTLASLVRLGLTSRDPVKVGDTKVVPYRMTAAVVDSLPKPKEPIMDVDVQRCEVRGRRDGVPATVILDCVSRPNEAWGIDGGTVGTGTPPSIAAQWIAGGRITARGTVPPEIAVDPLPFFRELGSGRRPIEVWERGDTERVLSAGGG